MRKFTYSEPVYNEAGVYIEDEIIIKTEEDIKEEYHPYWYTKMCQKYGQTEVEANYTFEDCIMDWVALNWAEETP